MPALTCLIKTDEAPYYTHAQPIHHQRADGIWRIIDS